MLNLLNEQHRCIGSFRTYNEVISYIHNSQIYNLVHVNDLYEPLIEAIHLKNISWRFIQYKHSELNIIYSCMYKPLLKGIEKEAFNNGLDLIEIYYGSLIYPIQFAVTPDLDIESLKWEWCQAYCEAHGQKLVVALSTEKQSEISREGGSND